MGKKGKGEGNIGQRVWEIIPVWNGGGRECEKKFPRAWFHGRVTVPFGPQSNVGCGRTCLIVFFGGRGDRLEVDR